MPCTSPRTSLISYPGTCSMLTISMSEPFASDVGEASRDPGVRAGRARTPRRSAARTFPDGGESTRGHDGGGGGPSGGAAVPARLGERALVDALVAAGHPV